MGELSTPEFKREKRVTRNAVALLLGILCSLIAVVYAIVPHPKSDPSDNTPKTAQDTRLSEKTLEQIRSYPARAVPDVSRQPESRVPKVSGDEVKTEGEFVRRTLGGMSSLPKERVDAVLSGKSDPWKVVPEDVHIYDPDRVKQATEDYKAGKQLRDDQWEDLAKWVVETRHRNSPDN